MEDMEELLSIIKTLPEEGKIEFMAIMNEFNNYNIEPMRATNLIAELLEKYTSRYVQ